jgi:coenzyme F420-0:L-glutamate ligase/coenzyme F420-1:gamma-L-glutamate ligase
VDPHISEFIRILKERRSSKKLRPGDVPIEAVRTALEAAVYAANAHNAQPWRFIVIVDDSVKVKLLDSMERQWRRDLQADGLPSEKIEKIISNARDRSLRASVIVVACLTMEDMDKYPDSRRMHFEYVMAVQSVAAALQNLLLALHVLGLGACWRCSPLFAPDAVREALGVPETVIPQAMVEIGLPGGETRGGRKPLSEVCYLNRWGEKFC